MTVPPTTTAPDRYRVAYRAYLAWLMDDDKRPEDPGHALNYRMIAMKGPAFSDRVYRDLHRYTADAEVWASAFILSRGTGRCHDGWGGLLDRANEIETLGTDEWWSAGYSHDALPIAMAFALVDESDPVSVSHDSEYLPPIPRRIARTWMLERMWSTEVCCELDDNVEACS